MARVFAAMSGGVDSSVAAALLVREGHDVVGVTMRLLDEDAPGGCCPSGSVRGARLVCGSLGIPHYTWDMRETFEREVVAPFVDEYRRGRTPNPCVRCNERVKLSALLSRVRAEGGDALATGHYARVAEKDGGLRVSRGVDPAKDQSYFLYRCTEEQLASLLLPVGGMTKAQVRDQAAELGLATAEATESQDVCFVPSGDTKRFVRERAPRVDRGVEVVDAAGTVLGTHDSFLGLTVGERFSPGGGSGGRRYIVAIDADARRVTVGTRDDLEVRRVRASSPVWHGGEGVVEDLSARVRYRGGEVPARTWMAHGELAVELAEPVTGAAPGQSVVCWDGDIVIGGGVIEGAA